MMRNHAQQTEQQSPMADRKLPNPKRPCAACGKAWSPETFPPKRKAYCTGCLTVRARVRRADPKVRARETELARQHRRNNPETYLLPARAYYYRNRAKSLQRALTWDKENPERARAFTKVSN